MATTNQVAEKPARLWTQRILAYRYYYLVLIVAFILDRVSKLWIQRTLPYGTYNHPPTDPIVVIPGFFQLCHIGNTGAAWGMFDGHSTWLALFSLIALTILFLFRKSIGLREHGIQISIGLLCGGIVGNLFDRIVYRHVIDFLDFHLPYYRWPAFNVADMCILFGVIGFGYLSYRAEIREKKRSKA